MTAREVFGFKSTDSVFVTYRVELQVLDKLIGGIPTDPDVMRKWLAARLKMGERELIELAEKTYAELSGDEGRHPSTEEMLDVLQERVAGGSTFKRNPETGNLAWEGRCAKAALRESAHILYPGAAPFPGRHAKSQKGVYATMAETVFVPETYIDLGVKEPDGTEQRVKHVTGPKGRQSIITVVDYVERPLIAFHIVAAKELATAWEMEGVWQRIFEHAEMNGIGADRRRGDGMFELRAFEEV